MVCYYSSVNALTATGYVLSPDRTQILLIFHNKLGRWLPPGGHVDDDELPHLAVVREVFEETGLQARIIDFSPDLLCTDLHTKQIPAPYCMHRDEIPPYGQDSPEYYVDMVYIMQALTSEVELQLDEIGKAQWFNRDQLEQCDTWEIVKKIAYNVLEK